MLRSYRYLDLLASHILHEHCITATKIVKKLKFWSQYKWQSGGGEPALTHGHHENTGGYSEQQEVFGQHCAAETFSKRRMLPWSCPN